jgi:ribosome recycling factor
MSPDDILLEAEDRMSKALEVMNNEFKTIRTGRSNPALIENVKVDAYGAPTPLRQVAQISTPDPRTLMVKPFDPSLVAAIDKGIAASDLGLNPQNDGKIVRIVIPPLSEERRKQFAEVVRKAGETARVHLRNVRRDANRQIDDLEKEKKVSEDEKFRLRDQLQKSVDEYEEKVTRAVERKSKEIMEV